MTTFALSVAGFALAIIANLWTFALTWVRWPRVSVETRAYLYVSTEPIEPKDMFFLTVINRGTEAITISDIGVRAEDNSQRRAVSHKYDVVLPRVRSASP